jgi:transcriptional regulator with XRE-family HTH domain
MLPNTLSEIATAVKRRREVLRITQEHLASVSKVALRTIREVEQGTGNPSLETLVRLFEVLGLELKINVQAKGLSMLTD